MSSDSPFIQTMAIAGAVLWSVQIWLNYRRGHTIGLHQGMMILWSLAGLPLGIHNILSHQHVALQVQAQILTALSLVTWSQVMYYSHGWSSKRCAAALSGLVTMFASIEAVVVCGFRYGTKNGKAPHAFIVIMAVLSALGLAVGVLRHYLDIWQERTVRGISWGFILLDAGGDLASLLAVVCVSPPDYLSAAIYATELALWLGIMAAGVAFYLVHKLRSQPDTVEQHSSPTLAPGRTSISSSDSATSLSAFSAIRAYSGPSTRPLTLVQRIRGRRASAAAVERLEHPSIAMQTL